MSDWQDLKRPFRRALIAAYDWDSLEQMLAYCCDGRLDRLTSKHKPFDKNVDDVIANAVRMGWLEDLARCALDENTTHSALQNVVPSILAGVKQEGKRFYQVIADEAFENLEASLATADVPFGEQLKEHKSSSQISYRELSRRADVPRSTIANWAQGATPPRTRWQDIVRVANSLDMTEAEVNDLLNPLGLPTVRELLKLVVEAGDKDELEAILARWTAALAEDKLRVFLCRDTSDAVFARRLYDKLLDDGLEPWLAEVNLLPGMKREELIAEAVRSADVVMVLLAGDAGLDGREREIALALALADEQPQEAIFLIPVRLAPCAVPEALSAYQWADLYEREGYNRLLAALDQQARALGRARPQS